MSGQGRSTRVGVIEDHPLYRAALARLLDDAVDVELGAVAESVEQFTGAHEPAGSVVVLDLKLRGVTDAAAVAKVVAMGHRVLVVSGYATPADILGAIGAGALGYLSKHAAAEDILQAVRTIGAGGSYVSPELAGAALDSARHRSDNARLDLSERERQVLALVAAGERDQDIADEMAISVRTVRSYLDRIRDKTGLRRRTELTRLAIEEGFASW
ncbi:LuxR C-terminal-related transcriptional regulator [Amycolatopsis palatopharyngis]|uniref:LuxR C-terminal-related transcriptional regulator n=1 Tax=Amycolatopsis palatopharyngis TaxID=187982 RepID=UPI000E2626FF|nr:response regulator transcription factor [Amycolatopsis palatopharyngis]